MGGEPCSDQVCRDSNLTMLRDVTSHFKGFGIKYWLDFGALLGVVREGDLIVGDDDTDLSVSTDEYQAVMEALSELTKSSNYTVEKSTAHRHCGDFSGKDLLLYQVRDENSPNALLDVFFFQPDPLTDVLKSMWTSSDDTKLSTVFPVQDLYVTSWGFAVQVPADPIKRLVEKYGKDYMTPKSTKNSLVSKWTRSAKVWSRCTANKLYRTNFLGKSNGLLLLCIFVFYLFYFPRGPLK